jgi:hypothetical protein
MLSLFAWPAADVPAAYAEDGGIYRVGSGVLSFNGGTINNNRAVVASNQEGNPEGGNGGGVYLGTSGFTLLSGEVSGNTAEGNGDGFYVSASNTLNLSPVDANAINFGSGTTANDIYLPNSAGTVAGQVYFNIGADLYSGVSSDVPLAFQTPFLDATVAVANDEGTAESSSEKLVSGDIAFYPDDIYIKIASTR